MNYGLTATVNARIKCNGIEDFWGNVYDYIDGLYIDSNGNVKVDDGSGYTTVGTTTAFNGWVTKIKGTNKEAFLMSDGLGSSSEYFCDVSSIELDGISFYGADYDDNTFGGAFSLYAGYNDAENASIGARLTLCK